MIGRTDPMIIKQPSFRCGCLHILFLPSKTVNITRLWSDFAKRVQFVASIKLHTFQIIILAIYFCIYLLPLKDSRNIISIGFIGKHHTK